MYERKKIITKEIIISLAFMFILLGFALLHAHHVRTFNNTARSYRAGDASVDLAVSIAARSGNTDSWVKEVGEGEAQVNYYGTIYDLTVKNTGDFVISDWTLTLDVPRDCYLNNAWCGKTTITQRSAGKTQTLDLRNYQLDLITLDHQFVSPDLLIPLHQGDTIEYHPDESADEFPISSPASGDAKTDVVFGLIFYTMDDTFLAFPSYTVTYHLERSFRQGWEYPVLAAGVVLWLLTICVFFSVEWSMRKAHLRFAQDGRIILQSISVFTHFFEAKDIYTTGHSQRVANYTKLLSEKLGLPEDTCLQNYYIALMHDCGKCYIPDEILKKPGKLTPEEFEMMKSHTVRGAEMLKEFTAIGHIQDGALYHHERYDGKGYPTGKKGEEIPLIGRIICVADSFDAMNSRRCYRDMLSVEKIEAEIHQGVGTQFDPVIASLLLDLIAEGKIKYHEKGDFSTQPA